MPYVKKILKEGTTVEVARIKFKVHKLAPVMYNVRTKSGNIMVGVLSLTTGDGFYLNYHFPVEKIGKEVYALAPDGRRLPVNEITPLLADTFKVKHNKDVLKTMRKLHLTAKTKYLRKPRVVTILTFGAGMPIAVTFGLRKIDKPLGIPYTDIVYAIKDRDAIEEAGITVGAGTKLVEKEVDKIIPGISLIDKDLQTVYRFDVGNPKLVSNKLVSDITDPDWKKAVTTVVKATKDPLAIKLLDNFVNGLPSVALNSGVMLPPTLRLIVKYSIPLGGNKGNVQAIFYDYMKRTKFSLKVKNPNPRGRKAYIDATSLLLYPFLNAFIQSKHSNKKAKMNVLKFNHI